MYAREKGNVEALKQRLRDSKGSMLCLTMVCISLIAFSVVIGYSFWGLLFINSRLHTAADEIALAGAKKLNDRDRIGQMNNMIQRCRHLVYLSRKDFEKTKTDVKDLEGYSEMLLNESKDSATDLEKERKNAMASAKTDANKAMTDRFNQIKTTFPMQLPWLIVGTPKLKLDGFGKVKNMESNVEEIDKIPELAKKDRDANYVKAPKGGLALYEAESDKGKLQEDSNLEFKISSLPAPVKRTIAPARTFLQKQFETGKTAGADAYFPSSAKVTLDLEVESGIGPHCSSNMEASGVAITTGALPWH